MHYLTYLFLLAHSWYPSECCSDKDCKPVPCAEVIPQADGSYIYQGISFAKEVIKAAPDVLCHACINTVNKGLCLFIPLGIT